MWLVGWLVGWLGGCLGGWLVGWLVGVRWVFKLKEGVSFFRLTSENRERKKDKRPKKVIGWHMLNFHFIEKIKVGYGSNCTKFPRTDQRSGNL